MQFRRIILMFTAACTAILLSGIPVIHAATPEFTLRTAHYFKEDHPWHKGLAYFAKKVNEDSKGRIQVDIFNGGILGSEAQTMQFVKDGSLDFVVSDPSAGAPFAKELDFFALPFLFRDYAHWQKALDGEPGQRYAKLIEEKTGIKILGYWGGSGRNVLATKKPVLSIDDMKGFRLRLISSPLKVNAWKAVGAVPTPIAFMETYLAMKSGVVDGMENESVAVLDMKFYEPAPYIARTEHEFTRTADVHVQKDLGQAAAGPAAGRAQGRAGGHRLRAQSRTRRRQDGRSRHAEQAERQVQHHRQATVQDGDQTSHC